MKHKLTLSSLLLAGILTLAPTASAATTWYVNGVNGSDTNNCKLPTTACGTIGHAISLAHSGDSIMVAAATYYEHLTIGLSLTILGSSAQTTIIDGGGHNTVATISNSAARVTLSQLTIRHGVAQNGGGIYNSGMLTINHCVISGNSAGSSPHLPAAGGGIYSAGTLAINNSTIQGNSALGALFGGQGGGIYTTAILTINDSTITGNNSTVNFYPHQGAAGGGIYTRATLTINNSTISGNTAEATGRCFPPYCFRSSVGGGIAAGNATINNTTISGNSADYEGGGIYGSAGSATLQNSIVANNGLDNCLGTVTSHGYNLSSDNTCNFHSSGDRNNVDPKLATLGNYGGPTQTIPLFSGSPAIDAGNPSGCTDGSGHLLTKDQRGYPRHDPEDTGGCDMGAYERQTD